LSFEEPDKLHVTRNGELEDEVGICRQAHPCVERDDDRVISGAVEYSDFSGGFGGATAVNHM
jgi:hypothetical protein